MEDAEKIAKKIASELVKLTVPGTTYHDVAYTAAMNALSHCDKIEKKQESDTIPYEKIVGTYNSHCQSLTKVVKLTDARKKSMRARWNENQAYQCAQFWIDFFTQVNQSSFLTGKDTKWKADFDWLMKPNNFTKVLEGGYK